MKIKVKMLCYVIYLIMALAIIYVFYETVNGTSINNRSNVTDDNEINDQEQIKEINEEREVSRIDLVTEILKYTNKVAYKELGRCYKNELPITEELEFDVNIDSYEGIDGLGFVDWCYRFAIGKALENVEFPFALYDASEKIVNTNELKIGDIGYGNLDSEIRNTFGVFIGYYENIPVFATCRYSPFRDMEWGGLQVAFLKSEKNEILYNAEPVDLKYFIRPNVEWLNGIDTGSIVMTNQGLKVKE